MATANQPATQIAIYILLLKNTLPVWVTRKYKPLCAGIVTPTSAVGPVAIAIPENRSRFSLVADASAFLEIPAEND